MKKPLLISLVAITICATSCHHEVINCSAAAVNFYFIGFNTTDFSYAVAYKYKNDGLFDTLVDSSVITADASTTSDTLIDHWTHPCNYDYMLVLPALADTYRITAITPGNHTSETKTVGFIFNDKAYACTNPIASYTLNGKKYQIINNTVDRIDAIYVYR